MNTPTSITLYKVHQTGKIGYWTGSVMEGVGGVYLQFLNAGSMDAKAVESRTPVEGKNIGRANETTPLEQARLELQSRAKKKMDGGYVMEMPKEGDKATNSLGFTKPQKAKAYKDCTDRMLDKIDWDNAFVQRKYDGHRCTAGDVLYSSGGKSLDHLPLKYVGGLALDGELYIHGMSLQDIGKLIKKYRPGETEKLQYVVFDQVSDLPFEQRYAELKASLEAQPHVNIVVADTYRVRSMEEVMEYHKQFLAEGYEGTMLRQGTNPYKGGARCIDIIKVKDMDDSEFKIRKVLEGKTKLYQGKVIRQARFLCVDSEGREFSVLAPGTVPEKREPLINPELYIGKDLTVQYFGFTDSGLPNLPVAKNVRDYL